MHFGSGPIGEEGPEQGDKQDAYEDCDDPFVMQDHLIELRECHKFSKSVFFIVSTTFMQPNFTSPPPSLCAQQQEQQQLTRRRRSVNRKYLCLHNIHFCCYHHHHCLSLDTLGHGNRKSDTTAQH